MKTFKTFEEAEYYCEEEYREYFCGCGCGSGNTIEYKIVKNTVVCIYKDHALDGSVSEEEEIVGIINGE